MSDKTGTSQKLTKAEKPGKKSVADSGERKAADTAQPTPEKIETGRGELAVAVDALNAAVKGQRAAEAEWKAKVAAARNAVRKSTRGGA